MARRRPPRASPACRRVLHSLAGGSPRHCLEMSPSPPGRTPWCESAMAVKGAPKVATMGRKWYNLDYFTHLEVPREASSLANALCPRGGGGLRRRQLGSQHQSDPDRRLGG